MKHDAEKLFHMYYPEVYRYLYSLTRDALLSEDLAAEVFLEVVRSVGGFRGESDVRTWLFSIARHRWFHELRRKKKEPLTEMLTEFLETSGKSTEDIVQNREIAERVRKMLDGEDARTAGIVRMRLEGYSFYEIGERFGVSENSARVIEFRARKKIRARLQKEELFP